MLPGRECEVDPRAPRQPLRIAARPIAMQLAFRDRPIGRGTDHMLDDLDVMTRAQTLERQAHEFGVRFARLVKKLNAMGITATAPSPLCADVTRAFTCGTRVPGHGSRRQKGT
jgi:hypothetical protein